MIYSIFLSFHIILDENFSLKQTRMVIVNVWAAELIIIFIFYMEAN